MKIIVTGFQPFGGETVNPSYEAVRLLENYISNAEIIKLELPVVFDKAAKILNEKIDETNPLAVICVGQAGGRTSISVERVAINLIDSSIKDNDGNQPIDKKITIDGENAYFSTLPIKAIATLVRENGIPCSISNSAGTYVFNELMYQVLYHINKNKLKTKAGFIHVPFSCEQVSAKESSYASMTVENISKGIKHAIEAVVNCKEDIHSIEGSTH